MPLFSKNKSTQKDNFNKKNIKQTKPEEVNKSASADSFKEDKDKKPYSSFTDYLHVLAKKMRERKIRREKIKAEQKIQKEKKKSEAAKLKAEKELALKKEKEEAKLKKQEEIAEKKAAAEKAAKEKEELAKKRAEEKAALLKKKEEEREKLLAEKKAAAEKAAKEKEELARKKAEEKAALLKKKEEEREKLLAEKKAAAEKAAKEKEELARKKAEEKAALLKKREQEKEKLLSEKKAAAEKAAKEREELARKRSEEKAALLKKRKQEREKLLAEKKAAAEKAAKEKEELARKRDEEKAKKDFFNKTKAKIFTDIKLANFTEAEKGFSLLEIKYEKNKTEPLKKEIQEKKLLKNIKLFLKEIKAKDFKKAEKHLPEISQLGSEEAYLFYEDIFKEKKKKHLELCFMRGINTEKLGEAQKVLDTIKNEYPHKLSARFQVVLKKEALKKAKEDLLKAIQAKEIKKAQEIFAEIKPELTEKESEKYNYYLEKEKIVSSLEMFKEKALKSFQTKKEELSKKITKKAENALAKKEAAPVVNAEEQTKEETTKTEEKKSFFTDLQKKLEKEIKSIKSVFNPKSKKEAVKTDALKATEELIKSTDLDLDEIKLPEENIEKVENILGSPLESETDILENILKQNEEEDSEETKQVQLNTQKKAEYLVETEDDEEFIEYKNPFLPYMGRAYSFMLYSIAALALAYSFFFIQQDENNTVLSLAFNQKNLFVQEQEKAEYLEELNQSIRSLNKKLKNIEQGYIDMPIKVATKEITLQKIDWLKLRKDLEEATLDAFSYNELLPYIKYSSFSGDAEKMTFNIAGTITHPAGRVFLLKSKLAEAINKHPSFSGAEIKNFSKTKNSDEEIGGYQTSFSLTLKYNKE
jgi:hypothetical protein